MAELMPVAILLRVEYRKAARVSPPGPGLGLPVGWTLFLTTYVDSPYGLVSLFRLILKESNCGNPNPLDERRVNPPDRHSPLDWLRS